MKGKCEKCAEKPPKILMKGGPGRGVSGQCKNCSRITAPRASQKKMRSKMK
jgi:hypothetical protein